MKEIRAVVLGLIVVLLGALVLAFWRKPAVEFQRIKGYRVEVRERDGDTTRKVSFSVPSNMIARIVRLAPVSSFGVDMRANWDDHDVTPRKILDAADRSEPGKPGVIDLDRGSIEVGKEADMVLVDGDPSKELGALRRVVTVVSDGYVMDADALRKAAGYTGRPK